MKKPRGVKPSKTKADALAYLLVNHKDKSPGRVTAMAMTYKCFSGCDRTELTRLICAVRGKEYRDFSVSGGMIEDVAAGCDSIDDLIDKVQSMCGNILSGVTRDEIHGLIKSTLEPDYFLAKA